MQAGAATTFPPNIHGDFIIFVFVESARYSVIKKINRERNCFFLCKLLKAAWKNLRRFKKYNFWHCIGILENLKKMEKKNFAKKKTQYSWTHYTM